MPRTEPPASSYDRKTLEAYILSCRDGYLVRQEKMCAVARQDVCRDKTRPLLWQDTREAAFGRLHKGGRTPLAAAPLYGSLVSCHNRGLVLSQQTSCLATAHIFSCRTRYPSRQDTICVSPSSFNMHHPSSCMHHTRCIMHHYGRRVSFRCFR